MSNSLPDLPYSKRDTELILGELKSKLTAFTQGEWTDFLDSSPDYAVVKSAVALYDMNAFFCDQNVAETFLSTALLRESVVRKAKSYGYVPAKAVPATVTVKLTFPAFNHQEVIPAKTVWTINDLSFVNLEEILIAQGQTSVTVTMVQGIPYSSTYTATGAPFMKYVLPVTAGNIKVLVDAVEWTATDTFLDPAVETIYKVYEDVGGQTVCFGAEIGMQVPANGSQIAISAILTDGKSGNIYGSGILVRPVSVLRDHANNDITGVIRGTTLTSALGGDDVESIVSIKENAPKWYAAQARCVTESDYDAIARRYPGLKDVRVIGGEKLGKRARVFVTAYSDTPYSVADDFVASLKAHIEKYNMHFCEVVVQAPLVIEVLMSVDLGINRRSIDVAESIYNQVNTAINQYFNDLKLESSMYLSAISAAVQKIAGIDYAAFEFTLQSFATSKAGVLEIPVPKNAKLTSCVLKKLDGTVLFSGDGTSKVVNEVFHFSQQGLPDQKCTLSYTTTDLNVLTGHRQIAVLKSLQVDGVFT